jgi:hypothetical protein
MKLNVFLSKLFALVLIGAILFGGVQGVYRALAQDATSEPTAEVTPVVITAPVEIPADSTVVVIEAPEPAEPTPAETETPGGYALAILATAVIMALVFTPIASFLAKSIPASALPVLISQGRTLATSGQEYAKTTETSLDNIAFDELLKQINRLESNVGLLQTQVKANTVDIQNKTEPGK